MQKSNYNYCKVVMSEPCRGLVLFSIYQGFNGNGLNGLN